MTNLAKEIGRKAAIRSRAFTEVANRRIGVFFRALIEDDKETLARFTGDDFWAAVDSKQRAMEQLDGSARKEASPET